MSNERDEILDSDEDPMEGLARLRKEEQENKNSEESTDKEDKELATEEDKEVVSEEESEPELGSPEEEGEEDSQDSTPKTRKFKADGQEYEFTEQEMLDKFEEVFGKAVNFTNKSQKIAPHMRWISAIEQQNLSEDDIFLALDVLKGNKDAINQVIKNNEIDLFDLDSGETDTDYTPTPYGDDPLTQQVKEVISTISKDPEYEITANVITKQWDEQSRDFFANNPSYIEGLHNDIRSGLFDKVAPLAMKMKVFGDSSKSDLEYYVMAGEKISQQEQSNSAKASVRRNEDIIQQAEEKSREADKRRSASSTGTRSDRGDGSIDYYSDSEEDFDAWIKKVKASQ